MKRVLAPLGLVLACAGVAQASTTTYTFVNTVLENKGSPKVDGTITGTVTFDPNNPLTIANWSADFTAAVGTPETDYVFDTAPTSVKQKTNSNGGNPIVYYDAIFDTASPVTDFDLLFTDVNGVITLCDRSGAGQACGASVNTYLDTSPSNEDAIVGNLAPIGAAPEPSSLALLGTGLLGVVGAARRRFARL